MEEIDPISQDKSQFVAEGMNGEKAGEEHKRDQKGQGSEVKEDLNIQKKEGVMLPLEEDKVANEVEAIKQLVDEGKKPSKKLSELALKKSKSPDPFVNSHIREEEQLMKFIGKTPFGDTLQTIDKSRKNMAQLKAYKSFFVSLFESVLIMKRIEPPSDAELEIRALSIPRPMDVKCNFKENFIANKTLVLDLDETIIHCEDEGKGDVQIPIKLPDGSIIEVFTFFTVG